MRVYLTTQEPDSRIHPKYWLDQRTCVGSGNPQMAIFPVPWLLYVTVLLTGHEKYATDCESQALMPGWNLPSSSPLILGAGVFR